MFFAQLSALLWKNYITKIRTWSSIAAQIFIPICICCIVAFLQITNDIKIEPLALSNATKVSSGPAKQLVYTPRSPALEEFLKMASPKRFSGTTPFSSTKAARKYISSLSPNKVYPMVHFMHDNSHEVPKQLVFVVAVDVTSKIPRHIYGDSIDYKQYEVLELQYEITRAFIKYWQRESNRTTTDFHVLVQQMPLPEADKAKTIMDSADVWRFVSIVFLGLLCLTASDIVEEKTTKIKESMKLMGLGETVYWLSWFIISFIYGTFIALMLVLVMCVDFSSQGTVLNTSPLVFFLMEIMLSVNTVSASFVIACITTKVREVLFLGVLLHFAMEDISYTLIIYNESKLVLYLMGTVLHRLGYFMSMSVLIEKENLGQALTFDNIGKDELELKITFLDGLLVMTLNTIFNFYLVWYLNNIFPGKYGIRKPYYFFVMKHLSHGS
ncbi:phospholipid-transporting ATPase ABCA3-like [Physella acuta]|uniref:phospholipid-transporting ATPase ABCA3-like n=1 Tax=Physella acuta TaxID=109671 RepID=UPI0027DDBE5E|nr:phospholipid-transporting ATPase ABCA3-like [Physella acuta]